MLALLLVACSILPAEPAVGEEVDLIEVNHFYDDQGRLVFDQCIFYDWDRSCGRYQVLAWRLAKDPAMLPVRDWHRGGYVSAWFDGEVLRRVRADAVRETWTQYDPELVEREHLPKDNRRELRVVKVDKPAGAVRPPAP